METLSCSLSLAFLAEVTGRGYQREGFSGFLRAVTVTERAIARSVDCECPISPRPRTRFARPRFALSRSDWAIHLYFPTSSATPAVYSKAPLTSPITRDAYITRMVHRCRSFYIIHISCTTLKVSLRVSSVVPVYIRYIYLMKGRSFGLVTSHNLLL